MDATFFLKQRTAFIRIFYDTGVAGFEDTKQRIEAGEPPYDNPPYSEDGEPPYVTEWIDADTGRDVLSQACVALLSDSLKLYLNTLRLRTLRFEFEPPEKALLKKGFVAAYRSALGDVFDTDWSDCPVRFEVIEQIVLARNQAQHSGDITSFRLTHGPSTLRELRQPIFVDPADWQAWIDAGGDERSFLAPSVKVSRDALFEAIAEVDRLGDWVEARIEHDWRRRGTAI
ncbi:MAG: hypothetical protein EON86_00530 [Brevundimonas sp.]|nr:MAG: hypothetical protein EON86_00530 [Brevundimonas sp.]